MRVQNGDEKCSTTSEVDKVIDVNVVLFLFRHVKSFEHTGAAVVAISLRAVCNHRPNALA